MPAELEGLRIQVQGIVQGVGFRPFIFNLAEKHDLKGFVKNTSQGVEITLNGRPGALQTFLRALRENPPPLAHIDRLTSEPWPLEGYTAFEILGSQAVEGEFLPVSPDVSICEDCRRELFDPNDRRYRYPFINCTNCGPRFTIIEDIPYDRPNTTMRGFELCPQCAAEYHDPRDRRFHAQPIACPACGPQVRLELRGQPAVEGENAIRQARRMVREGKIVAIKGLGGYHLACDASNPRAVAELRRRKKRSDKPFALMAFDLETIKQVCEVSQAEEALLTSREKPVLLLPVKPDNGLASAEIAPGLATLGIMLPYTPLHLLLLEPGEDVPDVWVMTSGNLSEEPIAYLDEDAHQRLHPLADALLTHNRPIRTRVDDSVVVTGLHDQPYFYRRSRGYAPDPVRLAAEIPEILATGAELKNTFCLTRGSYAFLSHHIGDMENLETYQAFEEGIRQFEQLFRVRPRLIACDLHPNYLATRYAETRAQEEGLPLVRVQHHHAHLAACLADNSWTSDEPVIGLSYDGTGCGTDGAIWGGEVLVGGYSGFERAFHLSYVPQPGGDLSVRKPARMALAHLWRAGLDWDADLPPVRAICEEERTVLHAQLDKRLNAPLTSSMGRLFDAASALMGIRDTATYEGQAAIEMEALVDPYETGCYPFDLKDDAIDPSPLWSAVSNDYAQDVSPAIMAARFHNGVAQVSLEVCQRIRESRGLNTIALSGGVWQNRVLLSKTYGLLTQAGFDVLVHRQAPANDGGIALGQAMVAAWSNTK